MRGPRAHVVICPDGPGVARSGARLWVDSARQTLAVSDRFSVALSGGNTPRELYRAVAQEPDLDAAWHHTQVFWSDERAVPTDDERSNFRMAREALLDDLPLSAAQIHRMPGEAEDLEAAARAYEATLREALTPLPHAPPALDLVLLGVGPDGHTASLFPGSPVLEVRDRFVSPVDHPGASTPRRLTLTLPVLNAAHRVIFVVTGADKAAIVARVLQGEGGDLPAARVMPAPGRLVWLLDESAASRLSRKVERAARM